MRDTIGIGIAIVTALLLWGAVEVAPVPAGMPSAGEPVAEARLEEAPTPAAVPVANAPVVSSRS